MNDQHNKRMEILQKQHSDLESRLSELQRRAVLTPAEQREAKLLKKTKLLKKDEMVALKRA